MKNTLADAVNQAIENRLSTVHTALPGEICCYDASTQLANVKPLIMRRYPDGTVEDLPIVNNVPVIFPAGGGGVLSFPVKQGDTVLLIFCEKSLDVWLSKGGNVDPLDRRKFDLSDGFAIPGLFSSNNAGLADSNNVVLQSSGGAKLNLNADGKLALGNTAAELLDLFEQTLTGLEAALTSTSIGLQPLVNKATFTAIKSALSNLKGAL